MKQKQGRRETSLIYSILSGIRSGTTPPGSEGLGMILKGRYLGPATSVGDESTHYVIPVVSEKKDKESTVKVDFRDKNDYIKGHQPNIIARSYVCIRYPNE